MSTTSLFFSACEFVLHVDLYIFYMCGDCIRPEMSDNLQSILCIYMCTVSLIRHVLIVCVFVCSSSPLNIVVSWAQALGLRPEQILHVEVQWWATSRSLMPEMIMDYHNYISQVAFSVIDTVTATSIQFIGAFAFNVS